MIQLQTKLEVIYDARSNKSGIIVLDLDLKTGTSNYTATIRDFVKKTVITKNENDEDVVGEYLEQICSKTINIENSEINSLFEAVRNLVPTGLTYTQRELERTKQAFLFYVQNDLLKDNSGRLIEGKTIYNISPDQWEIV